MTKVINLRQKAERNSTAKNSGSKIPSRPALTVKRAASSPFPSQPPKIIWEAPSFYFNPQKRYLSMVIVALVLGGGAMLLFSGDMLLAIFLLLSSLVLILYSGKRPSISKIMIDQRGVAIGDVAYPYKDIRSFWLHYDPGNIKELSLELKKWYMPFIKVSIENRNPLIIRSILVNFLPEKEHEHSLVDIIARKIGL